MRDKVDFEPDDEATRDRCRCDDGAAVASARTPYPEAARELLRETLFGAARDQLEQQRLVGDHDVGHRRAPPASAARPSTRSSATATSSARPSSSTRASASSTTSRRRCAQHLDDPRAAVGAALELFLRTAGEDPLIRILLSDDGTGGMLPFVTTQGMPVVQWATARLGAVIEEGWPQAPQADVAAARRDPGPARDQLHHRPRATRPRRPPPRSAELLGPFIDTGAGQPEPRR